MKHIKGIACESTILAEKQDSLRHSTTGFREIVLVAEDTLPNVKSFIILR